MHIDVNKVFIDEGYLKYPTLRNLVKEVMLNPEQDKTQICKKIQQIKPSSPTQLENVIFVLRKLWHRFAMKISKKYRLDFTQAVSVMQLSVKQSKSATKVQKVFRGHIERRKVKLIKQEKKAQEQKAKELKAAQEQQAKEQKALEQQKAKQLEKELAEKAKKKEAEALKRLSVWRKRHQVYSNLNTITLDLSKQEAAVIEKNQADIKTKLDTFKKYRDALSAFETAKTAYDKFFDSAGKKLVYYFGLFEDKQVTEARNNSKLAYDKAFKELNEIKAIPLITGFMGNLKETIDKLTKEYEATSDKIQRLNKVQAITQAKLAHPEKPTGLTPPPSPPLITVPTQIKSDTSKTLTEPKIENPIAAPTPTISMTATPQIVPQTNLQLSTIITQPAHDPYDIHNLKTAKGKMLNALYVGIHRDFKMIWEQFFKKCDPKDTLIKEWTCTPQGNFTLKLNNPLKMWVPSTNEDGVEDPKGGVVLMMGEPDKLVTGNLDYTTKAMNFDKGFSIHCRYSVPIRGEMSITPQVFRMVYEGKDRVLFGAGIELFGKKLFRDRVKTVDNLVTNWGKNGELVDGDQEKYIWNKLHPRLNKD